MTGVLENAKRVAIGGGGASNLGNDVFVALIVEIGECDSMAFVEFTRARRRGHIYKIFSVVIAE